MYDDTVLLFMDWNDATESLIVSVAVHELDIDLYYTVYQGTNLLLGDAFEILGISDLIKWDKIPVTWVTRVRDMHAFSLDVSREGRCVFNFA